MPVIGQHEEPDHSSDPDAGLPLCSWRKVKKRTRVQPSPHPTGLRGRVTLRQVQPTPTFTRETHTLVGVGPSWKEQGKRSRAPTRSKREPEAPGAEMARVAKRALVY